MQKTGLTPARGVAERALRNPLLGDELFGYGGDGAALQPGISCQVGARDGLARAYEVEDYAPVYVARRLARRHLKIG